MLFDHDSRASAFAEGYGGPRRSFRGGVSHGGGLPGSVSQFVRFVAEKLSVVVLGNGDDADIEAIAIGVATRYLPAPVGTGR